MKKLIVEISPELLKKLKIQALNEDITLKEFVTRKLTLMEKSK